MDSQGSAKFPNMDSNRKIADNSECSIHRARRSAAAGDALSVPFKSMRREISVKALKTLIVAVLLSLPGVSTGSVELTLAISPPLNATQPQPVQPSPIQLTPIVSGLSSPTFVANAGDGTNRLFIVEQAGVVKVLQPGAAAPTVFLDVRAKVLSGGERGLLGLAFHPQYEANGRFFIYYTRTFDGAIVVAEYLVSADPNVAGTTGTALLRISHSAHANHNGGMLAFGPDGYLYIGVGDGGSANDPPNNAQNTQVLLGKLLRIDVDHRDLANFKMYASPADNPYFGGGGQPEIFSIGWRNPWRFSFDRSTGRQWVGDVGQDAREEVDTPVVNGGNYGWRVYEGVACTGNDPALCNPNPYIFPLFDYTHINGRCAITGGYVYRGAQGALPQGTYVYGDFCTGEIFGWDGIGQSILLDTASNIASFGEDEQGEIYMVGLEGSLSRITSASAVPTCTYAIAPASANVGVAGGGGDVNVTTADGCVWTAASNADWIHAAAAGSGNGDVSYTVDANPSSSGRAGTVTIAGQTFSVSQQGNVACSYGVQPTYVRYSALARNAAVKVSTGSGCAWSAVSNVAWITISDSANGPGSGTVSYSVAALPPRMLQRTGTMTVAGRTVTVVQAR
jgi:glucose/arabinose dehydrogenase